MCDGQVLYLASSTLAPAYEGIELGIGDSILEKVIVETTGRNRESVKAVILEYGDLGEVANASRGTQTTLFTPKPLTCRKVLKVCFVPRLCVCVCVWVCARDLCSV